MSAEVELISTMVEKKSWTRPPIQMEFQVCSLLNTLHLMFIEWWLFLYLGGKPLLITRLSLKVMSRRPLDFLAPMERLVAMLV